MIYQIQSNEAFHEEHYIVSKDDEAAFDAVMDGQFYRGETIVSTIQHVEDLKRYDYLETAQQTIFASQTMLDALKKEGVTVDVISARFCLPDGTPQLDGLFWQMRLSDVPARFEETDPVRYWPRFKKFKMWRGVFHDQQNLGAWIGRCDGVGGTFCSAILRDKLLDYWLNLTMSETPTIPPDSATS